MASANPISVNWNDEGRVDINQIPSLKPLLDRFDLVFVIRTPRDKAIIREYARRKAEHEGRMTPNYSMFLSKYILHARTIEPRFSEEAQNMLSEYYADIAENYGSPRIRDTLFRLARGVARLKLKQVVDEEDARETMEFYNVVVSQYYQAVTISESPRDATFREICNTLKMQGTPITLEEAARAAVERNPQVESYIGSSLKLRDNYKLRRVAEMLLNHSSIKQVQEKPLVLQWISRQDEQ